MDPQTPALRPCDKSQILVLPQRLVHCVGVTVAGSGSVVGVAVVVGWIEDQRGYPGASPRRGTISWGLPFGPVIGDLRGRMWKRCAGGPAEVVRMRVLRVPCGARPELQRPCLRPRTGLNGQSGRLAPTEA